jgi:hypothetical protein
VFDNLKPPKDCDDTNNDSDKENWLPHKGLLSIMEVESELEDHNYINTYLNALRSDVLYFSAMLKVSQMVAHL